MTPHRQAMYPSRRLIGVAVAFGVLAAVPAAAEAANTTTISKTATAYTVRSVEPTDPDFGGATNAITVTEDPAGGLRITDGANDVVVIAEAPCSLLDSRTAVCPPDSNNDARLEITPGVGNDEVLLDLPARPSAGLLEIAVFGGYGLDIIRGSAGDDILEGDAKNGTGTPFTTGSIAERGDGGGDLIIGGPGRDTLRGQGGSDYLNGGTYGQTGPDAANTLDGGGGSDFFDAGATLGPDRFTGGINNGFFPGSSSQVIAQGLPNDVTANGRKGDIVSYETRTYQTAGSTGVTADLDGVADDGTTGASEGDQIDADVESLAGTIRDDTITGGAGANALTGSLGKDTLAGGSGGADQFRIRDGIRDTCIPADSDNTIDADLQDPAPSECTPVRIFPTLLVSFTFNFKPADETIPYVGIGALKRKGSAAFKARVNCSREAAKPCTGDLKLAKTKGGAALATTRFRLPPGKAATVKLKLPAARVAALRKTGSARLTTVSKGTSKKGPTSTQVYRRVK